jgi:hypothetical protein
LKIWLRLASLTRRKLPHRAAKRGFNCRLMLTTEAMISDVPEKDDHAGMGGGMPGGMGGMGMGM